MALKSTIYKAQLQIADMDRGLYADHALTLARHPSENDERLMMRVLAFALNVPADDHRGRLEFARGLSDTDEPDLWQHDLSGQLFHWIEVGQPDERRMLKAAGPLEDAPSWLTVRLSDGGDARGLAIYGVDTKTPLQGGRPRVLAGASELLGVVGPGGRAPEVPGREGLAAVALAYNADCFAVVPIQPEARETVAELTAVAEQEFTLSFPSTDAREDVSGEFRFAAILDELQVLSCPLMGNGAGNGARHLSA
jgi:hypothetical protein